MDFDIIKRKINFIEELGDTAIFRNELAHEYMRMSSFYSIKNIKKVIDN